MQWDLAITEFNPYTSSMNANHESFVPAGNRRHRLPSSSYTVPGSSWHITIGVADRKSPPFDNREFGHEVLRRFATECESSGSVIHVGCLMPDHAHLLIEVGDASLEDILRRAKSATTRIWWKHGGAGKLWQQGFYDHGIRGKSDFDATVTYILENPVRAGLVDHWETYPLLIGALIDPDTGM